MSRNRDMCFGRAEALERVRRTGTVMGGQNRDAGDSTRRLDDEELVSTSLKLPISLKSRVKAYATLHHMTLAQVLAEGAELLMERDEKKL